MPKYRIELSDGRKFEVEADSPPSESDILAHLGAPKTPWPTAAAPQAPGAAYMLGQMGRGPLARRPEPMDTAVGRLRTMAEPATQPWMQESALGKIAGLTAGLLPEAPQVARYYASAAKEAIANAPKLRNLPGQMLRTLWNRATDTRTAPEMMQQNFNNLPLYEQMERLPTRATGPIGGTVRTAEPRPVTPQPNEMLSDLDFARREVAAGRLPESALAPIERAQQPKPMVAPVRVSSPPGSTQIPTRKASPNQQTSFLMEDWHSGAPVGSAEAKGAQALHRYEGETASRYAYMLGNKNGAWLAPLVAPALIREALMRKLGDEQP